jgi:hypothetical protein
VIYLVNRGLLRCVATGFIPFLPPKLPDFMAFRFWRIVAACTLLECSKSCAKSVWHFQKVKTGRQQ